MGSDARSAEVRRRLPAGERRALILETGGALFGARGYDGTTLDDVAAAAGVTKPILYRHFDSKQSLYMALLINHAGDMPGFVSEIPRDSEGQVDMRAILDPWFAYASANQHDWRMLFRDAGGDEEIVAFRREVRDRAGAVIISFMTAAAVGAPDVEPAELSATAEVIRAGLAGLVLWWGEHPDVSRDAVVSAAARLLQPLFHSG